jgi:hypothetical protein
VREDYDASADKDALLKTYSVYRPALLRLMKYDFRLERNGWPGHRKADTTKS